MEKLILYTDKDGGDRSIRPQMDKRQVRSITVAYNPPVTRRQAQRVIHALEAALAGAVVAIDGESEEAFLARVAAELVPADAVSWQIASEGEAKAYADKREEEREAVRAAQAGLARNDNKPAEA